MSVHAIYGQNEFGDVVPSGGVWVSPSILSLVHPADVKEALRNLDLSDALYEEALSRWSDHRLQLKIDEELEHAADMTVLLDDYDSDDMPVYRPPKTRESRVKRGEKRQARHREFEKIKKRRVYIVENSPN